MNPSASHIHRADVCPAAYALPHVNTQSEAAKHGTIGHKFLELCAAVGAEDALLEADEDERDWLGEIDTDAIFSVVYGQTEVCVSYNAFSEEGRIVGQNVGRNYGSDPEVIYGTADALFASNGIVRVYDYKFDSFDSTCEPAKTNPQMATLALAACRAIGADEADVCLIHIKTDGSAWFDKAHLTAFDLDAHAERLRSVLAKVHDAEQLVASGRTPNVTQGSHCRWCPAVAACPAITSLVRSVALAPMDTANAILEALTPETAAAAYERLEQVQQAIKPVAAALALYASDHPIRLKSGKFYGACESSRRSVDGAVAFRVIEQMHGIDKAKAAVDFKSSQAAIKRALTPVARQLGVSLVSLEREVLKTINELGGVKTKTSVVVREYSEKGGSDE